MRIALFVSFFLFSIVQLCASTFTSHSSGNWNGGLAVWTVTGGADPDNIPDGNDVVIISSGTNVTWGQVSVNRCASLNVQAGATLTGPNNTTFQLRIFGDYVNNGAEARRGIYTFQNVPSITISGSGTFAAGAIWNIYCNVTVASDVTKTHIYWCRIFNGSSLTNNGNLTFNAQLTAYDASTVVTNNGTITIRDQKFLTEAAGGSFDPSAATSVVNINWISGSNINLPQALTSYNDLNIQGSFQVRANSDTDINGDLTIANNAIFNINTSNITLAGDWINNGGDVINGASLTFDGSTQNLNTLSSVERVQCDITIAGGSTLNVNDSLVVEGDISLNGTLDPTVSNNGISLTGDWTNNGSFVSREGMVSFIGNSSQFISSAGTTAFFDLNIDNSSGVIISNGSYTLANTLYMNDGDFNVNGNSFTILSTSSRTGRIGPLCPTCSVSGDITMQRFIEAGAANYKDLASPFLDVAFTDWDDELIISGPSFPDGCAYGGNGCFTSVKFYNSSTQAYEDVSGPTDLIANLTGYEIFLGDDLSTFSGATISATGTVNGPANLSMVADLDWNLIGNPFCSEFDFDQLMVGSNIGDFYYIFDQTTGNYEFYDNASKTSSGSVQSSGIIASGQGFWVYGIGGGAFSRTLTFPQTAKRFTSIPLVKSSSPITQNISINVKNLNNDFSCKSTLKLDENSIEGQDTLDIPMFAGPTRPTLNPAPSIYFDNGINKNRLNTIPSLGAVVIYEDLKFMSQISGKFEISADDLLDFISYNCVLLYDREADKTVNLRTQSYTFEHNGSNNESNRFELILSNEAMCDVLATEQNVDAGDAPSLTVSQIGENLLKISYDEFANSSSNVDETHDFKLIDITGRIIFQSNMQSNNTIFNIPNLSTGTYIATLGSKSTKVYVK